MFIFNLQLCPIKTSTTKHHVCNLGHCFNRFPLFVFHFSSFKVDNYRLFPKKIGDIISNFEINELHLTQTQGVWRYGLWGEPAAQNVPSGLELQVWYNDLAAGFDDLWSQTIRSLAGLTCTSVNTDHLNVEPKYSFRPHGVLLFNQSAKVLNSKRLKYVSVPSEILCTENLTPFLKLLPCDKYAGLAQLLTDPSYLFDTKFNSIGLHLRHVCLVSNPRVSAMPL
jgi:phosphatidylinositol glycan class T